MQQLERERIRHKYRMKEIARQGELKKMKQEERDLKRSFRPKRKINTSKAALWYMMIMCTIIQIYSLVAMWHFMDLSPLTALIGATVGEVFAYWAYSLKAGKENCEGGITYEMALRNEDNAAG